VHGSATVLDFGQTFLCAFIIAFISLLAHFSHQVSPNLIAMAGKLASSLVRLHRKSEWTGCGGNSLRTSEARERLLKVTALTLAGEEAATVEVGVYSHVLHLKAALKAANKKLVRFEVLLLNAKKPLSEGMLLRNAFRVAIAEHDAGASSPLFGDEHAAETTSLSFGELSSICVTVTLIQLPPTFEHKGSWSGCGGNPQGSSESRGCGNCSPACSKCGASSHWSCCGSTFRKGKVCAMGITEDQALINAKLCYDHFDGVAPVYSF